MPQYQYGTMFEKLGVLGMGRQGSGWCEFDPNGVLANQSCHESKVPGTDFLVRQLAGQ